MCDQYQEERDYMMGAASEEQNLYSQSMMEVRGDEPKINELLVQGRHVVVTQHIVYCRHTDASLGTRDFYVSDHATDAEAQVALRSHPFFNDPDPDPDPEMNMFVR